MSESFNPTKNEKPDGDLSRRDFLGFLGAGAGVLAGEAAGLGKLSHLVSEEKLNAEELKLLEIIAFPKIQEILKRPEWAKHSTRKGNIYYLTDKQWNETTGIKSRQEIISTFYEGMEKVVIELSRKSGIHKDTYILLAAKESNFGTSYLAQFANNIFSINVKGKDGKDEYGNPGKGNPVLTRFQETIPWNDDGQDYDFYKFKDVNEACLALGLLHQDWASRMPEFKNKKSFTVGESIKILVKNWNSGKHGAKENYDAYHTRTTERKWEP